MISTGQVIGFTLTSLVIIVIPGPGVLFVVGRALTHGRRTAVATGAGHAAGNYVVAACVAIGLGTLLERSAQVFTAVKLAGALYLIFLGVQAFRHRNSLASVMSSAAGASDGWRALRDGVIVGVTNPKSFILFGAILPQFVNRGAGNVPAQMLLLAFIAVCMGLASDIAWGLAASAVRAWFARSPRRYALVGGAGGLAMIGVGVTVALTGRSKLVGHEDDGWLCALSRVQPSTVFVSRRWPPGMPWFLPSAAWIHLSTSITAAASLPQVTWRWRIPY